MRFAVHWRKLSAPHRAKTFGLQVRILEVLLKQRWAGILQTQMQERLQLDSKQAFPLIKGLE